MPRSLPRGRAGQSQLEQSSHSFSFSRPPEPELGGGLIHPTTETCRSLEGTTARRKGFALYASTQKRIRSKGHRKLLRLDRNISDRPQHLFSRFVCGRAQHVLLLLLLETSQSLAGFSCPSGRSRHAESCTRTVQFIPVHVPVYVHCDICEFADRVPVIRGDFARRFLAEGPVRAPTARERGP